MKLAFVVQRYGLDINGGAELHCRWVAEHMKKYAEVEVLTTRAVDYITWKNHYPESREVINGVSVRRFPVTRTRHPERFGRLQNALLEKAHRPEDEIRWLEEEGPLAPALIDFIREHEADYDHFIFFSYRYYHSYWGIRAVPSKSVLVPTAERDAIIHFGIFKDLFNMPRAFIYNSVEERRMINGLSGNERIPGDVVGVGTEIPLSSDGSRFRERHRIDGDYVLYIGRIDENKGCPKLFSHFLRFKKETGSSVKLVLIGNTILKIPLHPDIVYLGFLSEQDKFDALEGSLALSMPSEYESLSMVTLEAWAMGKPVLANANCEVLQGQCRRSNAGLYYDGYQEFKEALNLLLESPELRRGLGANGRKFYSANYAWDIIENKYLAVLRALEGDVRP
jgi:glycosyltransferase involved in cell wall biosynthesis